VRIPSKEERKLFRDAVADVRPLGRESARAEHTSPPARGVGATRRLRPSSPGTGTRRRPASQIEATLDLHGSTAEAARRRLQEFISDAHSHGLRLVRVVHGKGLRSGPAGPVLKVVVDRTLRAHDDVEAIEPARQADGGAGAVIVRLRGKVGGRRRAR